MTETILGAFIGALAMLTWIVLASHIYYEYIKDIKK